MTASAEMALVWQINDKENKYDNDERRNRDSLLGNDVY